MELNYFKDKLFDLLNESAGLWIADLNAEDRKNLLTVTTEDGSIFEFVCRADVKVLRDVRHWLNQVLPSEQYRQTAEPGKKPSVQESLKGRQELYQPGMDGSDGNLQKRQVEADLQPGNGAPPKGTPAGLHAGGY